MDNVLQNIYQIIMSIEICIENKLITPSLILIYSGIDIVASLTVEENKDVQKSEFIFWTEKYLISNLSVICKGEDLYAARCAIVHSMSAESNMSRKGFANPIIYSFGNPLLHEDLKGALKEFRDGNVIGLELDNLLDAFRVGVFDFLVDIKKDAKLKSRAEKRAMNMFGVSSR